jgi:hypothetical protein
LVKTFYQLTVIWVAETAGPIHHLFLYDWHFFVLSPSATPIQALTPIRLCPFRIPSSLSGSSLSSLPAISRWRVKSIRSSRSRATKSSIPRWWVDGSVTEGEFPPLICLISSRVEGDFGGFVWICSDWRFFHEIRC